MEKRTEVIGIRVTKAQMKEIETIAQSNNQKISEWSYQVLLKAVNKHNNVELNLLNFGESLLLEQLILLRFILVTCLPDKELTENKLQRIIKKANEMKSEKAQQLIKEFIADIKITK